MLGYNIVHISRNCKKAEDFICRFLESDSKHLKDVYKSFSTEKLIAYNDLILEAYKTLSVLDYRIIGHNTSSFTLAFMVRNPLNDKVPCFVVFTRDNEYIIH